MKFRIKNIVVCIAVIALMLAGALTILEFSFLEQLAIVVFVVIGVPMFLTFIVMLHAIFRGATGRGLRSGAEVQQDDRQP
ncbi:hypothetical protein P12x_002291 [Tundrisphaera lichenicola]|uniref:hypothetical protein n=1 Tax=Tundrisphaera lichenicola TaxID=2029860 RepID=UPI003EBE59D0